MFDITCGDIVAHESALHNDNLLNHGFDYAEMESYLHGDEA